MTKKLLFSLITTTVALLLSAGCSVLEKPSARLLGVAIGDVSLDAATLTFDVEVENPYSVALPLTDIDYNVTSLENTLFVGEAALEGSIPAHGTKAVKLPAKIAYRDVIRAFRGVRPGSQVPYDAKAGLSVKAPIFGPIRIPLSRTGNLDVPTVQDLKNTDWQKLLEKIK